MLNKLLTFILFFSILIGVSVFVLKSSNEMVFKACALQGSYYFENKMIECKLVNLKSKESKNVTNHNQF